jgi:hypothetical protein
VVPRARPRLAGTFALDGASLVSPPRVLPAEPWTEHGYPFYSGIGRYRRRFRLPPQDGARLLLLVDVGDDAVEAVVNGRSAGVRAWRPYELDVSDFVRAGENEVELRVANTAANLFGCDPRASGLRAPPRLVRLRP